MGRIQICDRRMCFLYCAIIISICDGTSTDDWLDSLIENIVQNYRPHQITIFENSTKMESAVQRNIIFQKFIRTVPTLAIDFLQKNYIGDNRFYTLPSLKNPRHVSVYVILHSSSNNTNRTLLKYSKQFIDFIVQLSPKPSRPKCLLITDSERVFVDFLETVLEYAWTKKFIDFSILEVKRKANPLIHTYNPFYQQFHTENFDVDKAIFPNKLRNGNGYRLGVSVFSNPPHLNYTIDHKGSISDVKGFYYSLMIETLKASNFTLTFALDLKNSSISFVLNKTVEAMERGKVNMMVIPYPKAEENSSYADLVLELDNGFIFQEIVAVVPILNFIRLKQTLELLLLIGAIPLTIVAFTRGLRLLRISYRYEAVFDLFRVLLGTTATGRPVKSADRVIFFTVLLVSFKLSFEFYSQLINVQVINSEVPFDSFEDIDQSPLKPFIHNLVYNISFADINDKHLQRLKDRVVQVRYSNICENALAENKSAICFISRLRALTFMAKYRDKDNKEVFKIAKPVLSTVRFAYTFERASPYIERFYEIMQRIYESGIHHVLKPNISSGTVKLLEDKSSEETIFLKHLAYLLACGYTISVFAFALELAFGLLIPRRKFCIRLKTLLA